MPSLWGAASAAPWPWIRALPSAAALPAAALRPASLPKPGTRVTVGARPVVPPLPPAAALVPVAARPPPVRPFDELLVVRLEVLFAAPAATARGLGGGGTQPGEQQDQQATEVCNQDGPVAALREAKGCGVVRACEQREC